MTSVSSALPWRSCTAVRAEADPPRLQRGRDDLRVVRTAVVLMQCGPRGGGPSPFAEREG